MSNNKLSGNIWLEHNQAMEPLYGDSDQIERRIWFKSKPLTREFCQRVVQLQLCTDSHDQGYASDLSQGAWSWFEIAILPDENSEVPKRTKDDHEMAWKSHSNQLAHEPRTMHYGYMFDRRSELLAHIEVGDVLAVRACVRFPGWANHCERAFITTRTINEDLFPTDMWTLTSKSLAKHDAEILDCMYTYSATSSCFVKAPDASLKSKIWFTTPAFDQNTIDRLESIQLLARARLRLEVGNNALDLAALEGSHSWFDIVVLDSPSSETPKVINGLSMVWLSHSITDQNFGRDATAGQLFVEAPLEESASVAVTVSEDNVDDASASVYEPVRFEGMPAADTPEAQGSSLLDEWRNRAAEIKTIKKAMMPGNAIGVRVCAQYKGGETYAETGQLAVRISNENRPAIGIDLPDVSSEIAQKAQLKEKLLEYQAGLECPEGSSKVFESPEVINLDHEIRADQAMKTGPDVPPPYSESDPRPLRLLSLDGGGVRGVSTLRILDKIMNSMDKIQDSVTNELRAPHPHEIFDMMAGTSTGGLIAIMLGRLRMSIKACEDAYSKVAQSIFSEEAKVGGLIKGRLNSTPARAFASGYNVYKSEPLIKAVQTLLEQQLPLEGRDAKLLAKPGDQGCKVFVVTCRASPTDDGQQVVQLRTYPAPQEMPKKYIYPDMKIWEAARATSAAPAYFERLKYKGEEFIDGGMGWNNPTPLLLAEASEVYGYNRPVGCIVSLGTGVPVDLKYSYSIGTTAAANIIAMLTNSERAHYFAGPLAKARVSPGIDKYVRLNLSKALSDEAQRGKQQPKGAKDYEKMIEKMEDWEGIPRIRQLTDEWLRNEPAINDCVEMLQRGQNKSVHDN